MNARALEQALAADDIRCTIESRDRLAVLTPLDERSLVALRNTERRLAATARAAEHGFTHLALDLGADAASDAALSRD